MTRIGIVGASGFIGRKVAQAFHSEQLGEVRPIVRSTSNLTPLKQLESQIYVADALDQAALRQAFRGCDFILHSVIGSPWVIRQSAKLAYQAAAQANIRRFIYLSSASVHGQAPLPGTDESSELSDRQAISYNNAKVQAERELLRLSQQTVTELVILRPGIVIGPESGWVKDFADALLAGNATLINQGRGICNSICIDNLIHAIRLALTASDVNQQAFLVVDQEQVSWADLYRPIAEAIGLDFFQIPNIDYPVFQRSLRSTLLEILRNSDLLNSALIHLPRSLREQFKQGVKQSLQQPGISEDKALLYQCQYKLPYYKAKQLLGYEPSVSFSEACDRILNWLATAGYPVKLSQH